MKELINQHDSEGRRHGVWEWYYSDGTLQWRIHYLHGKRHGVWEDYFSDGTLCRREKWHHGFEKGLEMWWNPRGRCTRKEYYLVIR